MMVRFSAWSQHCRKHSLRQGLRQPQKRHVLFWMPAIHQHLSLHHLISTESKTHSLPRFRYYVLACNHMSTRHRQIFADHKAGTTNIAIQSFYANHALSEIKRHRHTSLYIAPNTSGYPAICSSRCRSHRITTTRYPISSNTPRTRRSSAATSAWSCTLPSQKTNTGGVPS